MTPIASIGSPVISGSRVSHAGHGKHSDPKVIETILNAVRIGSPFNVAARAAGVHRNTLRRWLVLGEAGREPYAKLLRDVEQARDQAHLHALALIRQAMPVNWFAAAWFLERRYPELYAKTERHEIGGPGGAPVKIEAVRAKILDELNRISRQLEPLVIESGPVNGNGDGRIGSAVHSPRQPERRPAQQA